MEYFVTANLKFYQHSAWRFASFDSVIAVDAGTGTASGLYEEMRNRAMKEHGLDSVPFVVNWSFCPNKLEER